MDCATYQELYPKYSSLPLPREVWDTPECEAHSEHVNHCRACGDWTLARQVIQRGARVEDFPCVHIANRVTQKLDSSLDDTFEDPDIIIWQYESSGEYGIPVRDGGSSIIVINHCPWCGVALCDPDDKITTAEKMCSAIKRIIIEREKKASESQYDVMVCLRSVVAASKEFESVPVEGTAISYGQAVLKVLYTLQENYRDDDGEYTSKGMVGDVASDVYRLLDAQKPPEPDGFDRKEAGKLLTQEIVNLGELTSQPPANLGATIKTEVLGAGGNQYFVEMVYHGISDECFGISGGIHITKDYELPLLEERLEFTLDSDG